MSDDEWHNTTRYNLIVPQTLNDFFNAFSFFFFFWLFVFAAGCYFFHFSGQDVLNLFFVTEQLNNVVML